MAKNLTLFLTLILASLVTFLAGYLFTRNKNPLNQQALINNSLVSRFTKTEEKYLEPTGLFKLAREASFPVLSADGKEILYYNARNGEVRSVPFRVVSPVSSLLAKIQPGANKITWSANKTLLAAYSTGDIYYDLSSNFSKKYDSKIKNPVLDKTGTRIAYTLFDPKIGNGSITIADPRIDSHKEILPTRFASWQIMWLGDNELALVKPPTLENSNSSLFLLNVKEKTLNQVLDSKKNLEVAWSPNRQKILYSYTDLYTNNGEFYIMDLDTKENRRLSPDHNASGCAWSLDNKTVYCAGSDSFVFFDTSAPDIKTRTVNAPVNPDTTYATDIFLTSAEDYLIFKNSNDGQLYGLRIEEN